MKPPSPLDFYKSISQTKENLFDKHPRADKVFNSYLVVWYLSHFPDCIMAANRTNSMYDMPKQAQYEYLMGAIKAKKRYFKWQKRDEEDDRINLLMQAYNYSDRVARQAAHLFSDEQIAHLKHCLEFIGGETT